jgi:hypothetical protein
MGWWALVCCPSPPHTTQSTTSPHYTVHPPSEFEGGVSARGERVGMYQQRVPQRSASPCGGSTPPSLSVPAVDTICTALSLMPTVNGNTVRSFSTHGHQSAAKGSSTTVSRSDIRLILTFLFGSVV